MRRSCRVMSASFFPLKRFADWCRLVSFKLTPKQWLTCLSSLRDIVRIWLAGLKSRIHGWLTLDKASWRNAIARLRPVCRKWHANIRAWLNWLPLLCRIGIRLVGLLRILLLWKLLWKLLLWKLLRIRQLWNGVACIAVRTSRPDAKMDTNGQKQQYSLNPHDRNLIAYVSQFIIQPPIDRRRFLNLTSTAIFNQLKNR